MLLLWVRREIDSEHASDFVDFDDLED